MSGNDSTSEDEIEYGAESIQVLEGLDAVRETPGMYIGSTDVTGLHHLVYEVVDNSIDEAMGGYCDTIEIVLHTDGSVSVIDNGRGIPVGDGSEGRSALESILTVLHAGGKFDDNDAYSVSGGLHGVGVSVVNALSETLIARIKRDGAVWEQVYKNSVPEASVSKVRELKEDEETGTEIRFKPMQDMFETTKFEFGRLEDRLQELAFLNPGVKISIRDERDNTEETYKYDGGLREYVQELNVSREPLFDDIFYFEDKDDETGVSVEVALQPTNDVPPSIHSYANNIHTREGGTHMTGFKTSLTRVVNEYGDENGLIDEISDNLKGADIREGLTAVISIKHPNPQFEGQTKRKLGSSEVQGVVSGMMHEYFKTYLDENPDNAEAIVEKALQAAKARKAADKAKDETRRKSPLTNTRLPGKLSDCQTTDPEKAELFIVEGDSAGGTVKSSRDREFQAVLPLFGKILNVEKNRIDRVLNNDKIQNLIQAIGGGVGEDFNLDDVRYKNIIIFTDADVDGAHIRTLYLTFFYRYMRPLLEEGCVYAAKPPLYRIKYKGETFDAMSDAERDKIVEEKCNGNPTSISRFKGLGEMSSEQMWETTLNPENRELRQLTIEDVPSADEMFSTLMGTQVGPRKEFIKNNAGEANWVDI